MKDQKEMMKKYNKMRKQEKKIMSKGDLSDNDFQDLFNLRQDMALILDYLDPLYLEEDE